MATEETVKLDILDPQKIVDTIELLNQRIAERFPESGLNRVCGQLHDISENMKKRAEWVEQPVYWLRILTWLVCAVIVVFALAPFYWLGDIATGLELGDWEGGKLVAFIQLMEAAINDVVLIGAAIFFLLTIETRYKRQRALKAIHELRTIAHIIDMHQLTKDPHRIMSRKIFHSTSGSPTLKMTPFLLRRYLDYCSEMLSLTGKIAAVYVQAFDDAVALASASELETMTTGLSSKIWQKISILDSAGQEETPSQIHTS